MGKQAVYQAEFQNEYGELFTFSLFRDGSAEIGGNEVCATWSCREQVLPAGWTFSDGEVIVLVGLRIMALARLAMVDQEG